MMFAHTVRASRHCLARIARQPCSITARRTLIVPTAVRQADLVQDMYLRELKNYKPTPVKASDAEGQVQTFRLPSAPPSPEEGDLAGDLQSYETQAVEVEGQAAGGAAAVEEDWFEEEDDDEADAGH